MIYVCSLAEVPRFADAVRPSHLISLLGDDPFPPTPESVADGGHLKVQMHDIVDPAPGCITPEAGHLTDLIDFADRWRRAGPMVIHCYAGVSRSTAAALVVLCRYNPGREAEAAHLLRKRAPHAHPNRRMIELADPLMGCEGKLIAAVEAMSLPDFLSPQAPVSIPARIDEAPIK
jgi:predicted protein tyrosine phosphatase